MRRGDIVTIALPGDYGKPRPAVVVQSDVFNESHASVVVCPMTSTLIDAPLFRVALEPSQRNGLNAPSQIMVDKLVALRRERLGRRIGEVDEQTMVRLNRSLALFIGLA